MQQPDFCYHLRYRSAVDDLLDLQHELEKKEEMLMFWIQVYTDINKLIKKKRSKPGETAGDSMGKTG